MDSESSLPSSRRPVEPARIGTFYPDTLPPAALPPAALASARTSPRASLGTLASRVSPTGLTLSPASARSRLLPHIAVDLRGSIAGSSAAGPPPGSPAHDLEVLRTLGEGGMGRVFLARQHSLDREVAIKTLRDSATAAQASALLAEGSVMGRLEHPNIIPVHALGLDDRGRPVLVMKRVEGAPWSELVEDPGDPAWEHVLGAGDRLEQHLAIFMQVCSAIEFAHSRGVVHRDVKPENVLIGRYGEVYLADWGLAVRGDGDYAPDVICGTPSYMAPEMVRGERVDVRTDVYLLGAILHELLTGGPRNRGATVREALDAAASPKPVVYPPSVPEALARLANAATSADPAGRPPSAHAVRQQVAEYLSRRGSMAVTSSALGRVADLRRLLERGPGDADESSERELEVAAAEARFGLDQALREWPENPAAKQGRDDLEQLLAARRARLADLLRLAREHDPRISSRQRAQVLGAVAVVGLGLSLYAFVADPRSVTTRDIFQQSLVPVAVAASALFLFRRDFLRTALNRRAAMVFMGPLGIAVHRALGLLSGATPASLFPVDCLIMALVMVVSALSVFRWIAWVALLGLLGAIWGTVSPDQAMAAFSLATGLGLLAGVAFVWREPGSKLRSL